MKGNVILSVIWHKICLICEKRSLTWFGLRKPRSRLLDGLQLRAPLAKVAGVHVSYSAYWELRAQLHAPDTTRAAPTRGTSEPSDSQPWAGIFHVPENGVEEKKLCFSYGQYSEVVVVDVDKDGRAPFTKLVITTTLPGTGNSVPRASRRLPG